ncbi:DUF3037 domain-containing protein [Pedobacter psychrodurus]|uniref:DUF3037 domain-containing protein n=1 Tax=Pedobacter psychrodurus TaxID=2530456 RepID=A0A4R0PZA5_9SPHI|nr:DUF3037 domain-containing protein [Pedobacter psychrodurus]TCD28582.1 DUF3037 domain-containing protein [Pedobacter psychrodurus]
MNNTFAYIILQYCHSILTREAINVGILFKFSNENGVRFYLKEKHKLDLIYQEFDKTAFDLALGNISQGIIDYNQEIKESEVKLDQNFTEVIRNKLKWQDSLLQFSDPFISVAIDSNESTMSCYIKLLLSN